MSNDPQWKMRIQGWFWWGSLCGNGAARLQDECEQAGHGTRAKPALFHHPSHCTVMKKPDKEIILGHLILTLC